MRGEQPRHLQRADAKLRQMAGAQLPPPQHLVPEQAPVPEAAPQHPEGPAAAAASTCTMIAVAWYWAHRLQKICFLNLKGVPELQNLPIDMKALTKAALRLTRWIERQRPV